MQLANSGRSRPASLNAVVAELVAAVFVHVSFWLLTFRMLSIQPAPFLLLSMALLPVLWYFVSKLRSIGKLTPVYAVFLPLLAGLIGFRYFGEGYLELFNYLAKAVNEVHELALFPTASGYPETEVPSMAGQLALLLLGVLFSGLFAYAICRKVRGLALATTFLPAFVAFLCGLKPTMATFIFYAVSATFYLILLETRSKGTARRLTWLNGEISVALLVFLAILALALSGFDHSERLDEVRQQIATKITDVRYAPSEPSDGMPNGDLNQLEAPQYDEKTVLTLETPNAFSMYLRGFSGDVLKDGRWVTLDSDAYFHDYSLTSPWIRSNSFSPAISLGQLLDLKWQVQTTQYENGERESMALPRYPITINNEGAYSDRIYAPYEVSADSKGLRRADLSQDGIMAKGLKGKRSYELTVYSPLTKDYGNVSSSALIGEDAPYNSLYEDAFVPAEEAYSAFVHENELSIPEEYQELISELGASVVGSVEKQSDAVFRIRSYFANNFQYSLDIPATEEGEDALVKFLTETHTGYCPHFASVAVLLLREAGFPARYAEGYYVSPELVASVEQETDVVLEVPDSAAHAWVELYKEGVGWVPVEFTPGYFETQEGSGSAGTTTTEEPVSVEETPASEETTTAEDTTEEQEEDVDVEEEQDEEDPEEERSFSWVLLALPVLLLILLIPMAYDRHVRKRIEGADSAEVTALAYRYLIRVFRVQRLQPEESDPKRVARLLGAEQEAYLAAIDLFNKEAFSEEGLSMTERELVCDTVLRLTADVKLLRAGRKQLRREIKQKTEQKTEAHHGE